MSKVPIYYNIPTGIDKDVCDLILNKFENIKLFDSELGSDQHTDTTWRKSKHQWIPTDHWISGMMAHFIHSANEAYFHYDLAHWSGQIQYTVYDGEGTHYDWHTDICKCFYNEDYVRKLSITLLLSPPEEFEGGKFQIMRNPRDIIDLDLNMGDALIFSSDTIHRVTPITKGKRVSLVGWFSGPKFK